jgi:hypothetical protein
MWPTALARVEALDVQRQREMAEKAALERVRLLT